MINSLTFLVRVKNYFRQAFALRNKKHLPTEQLLKNSHLLKNLRKKDIKNLYQYVKRISYQPGEFVFHEGDKGDAFYIIEKGSVRVITENSSGKEIVLARLEEGACFGEQALLDQMFQRRNASVKTITETHLLEVMPPHAIDALKLNKKTKKILKKAGKKQIVKKLLNQSPVFHEIKNDIVKSFAENICNFADKKVIFSKGDVSDFVYFIISGHVDIYLEGSETNSKIVVELGPNQLFGELGVLKKQPRLGMAIAKGPVRALSMDADVFQTMYESTVELRDLVKAMQRIYKIPHRGVVNIKTGIIFGEEAVRTTFDNGNGKTITASQCLKKNIFVMQYDDIPDESETIHYVKNRNVLREITLAGEKVVSVISFEPWDELDYACGMLLEARSIETRRVRLFEESGTLGDIQRGLKQESSDIVCYCMNIKYDAIAEEIQRGVNRLEALVITTGAGSVCGACKPKINELLGRTVWSLSQVVNITPLTLDICRYQLKLSGEKFYDYQPGQHVIIQALIDGKWVERAYTLISTPEQQGYYEIVVKKEPHGYFSNWFFENADKQPLVRISPPQGAFTFNLAEQSPAIFFAGGIGITPALAFARTLSNQKRNKRYHIDYSVHEAKDSIFWEELASLAKECVGMTVKLRVTRVDGRINENEIKKIVDEFPRADFYVCGSIAYQSLILAALKSKNIADEYIHIEKFIHAGGPVE